MAALRDMSHHDFYPDALLRRILGRVRTIAMVGASPDWHKASSFAMKYLQIKGYRIIPVNPRAAGKLVLGETCYASLRDIPKEAGPIDMVDIFRKPSAAGPIVDDAIAIGAKVVWMQLGLRNAVIGELKDKPQRPCQVGWRFSMKASMPSAASRAIMLRVMTSLA